MPTMRKTGKRAWRSGPCPRRRTRHRTWAGDTAKTGSATTWVTGSYDPDQNTVFWGTGNPGPDWNGDARAATISIPIPWSRWMATRKAQVVFQFTPHDLHDWDSTEVPVLADAMVRGEKRKVVLFGNSNAFYYVLDRTTASF